MKTRFHVKHGALFGQAVVFCVFFLMLSDRAFAQDLWIRSGALLLANADSNRNLEAAENADTALSSEASFLLALQKEATRGSLQTEYRLSITRTLATFNQGEGAEEQDRLDASFSPEFNHLFGLSSRCLLSPRTSLDTSLGLAAGSSTSRLLGPASLIDARFGQTSSLLIQRNRFTQLNGNLALEHKPSLRNTVTTQIQAGWRHDEAPEIILGETEEPTLEQTGVSYGGSVSWFRDLSETSRTGLLADAEHALYENALDTLSLGASWQTDTRLTPRVELSGSAGVVSIFPDLNDANEENLDNPQTNPETTWRASLQGTGALSESSALSLRYERGILSGNNALQRTLLIDTLAADLGYTRDFRVFLQASAQSSWARPALEADESLDDQENVWLLNLGGSTELRPRPWFGFSLSYFYSRQKLTGRRQGLSGVNLPEDARAHRIFLGFALYADLTPGGHLLQNTSGQRR